MNQQQIYSMIEESILSQLENGIIPWRRCYHVSQGDWCISHQTKKGYSMLNQFLLSEPGEYWTFEQCKKEGFSLRKGCKSRKVVFWKILEKESEDNDGEIHTKNIPFLKYYNVFHESDIVGLPPKPLEGISQEDRERRNAESILKADKIVENYLTANPDIRLITSDRTPCFIPSQNTISMPEKCQFDSTEEYYSTLFHEMIHSTRKKVNRERLDGIEGRSREELVAEIGAAFLCGNADIESEDVIKNNSAYCAGWLQALRNNIKMLIWAASRSERAANYILGKVNSEGEEVQHDSV